jgi:2-amino-4-hydroxy-6-hydroxymethyldihydropteridine diphosphokinase
MPFTVVIALGSNLGDRRLNLLRAIERLKRVITIVRVSSIYETAPIGAPAGSPDFLNMAVSGHTALTPEALLERLLAIEKQLGRRRTSVRNAPRMIDLDLILHSAHTTRTRTLTLPHPRYREREFVLTPMREIGF